MREVTLTNSGGGVHANLGIWESHFSSQSWEYKNLGCIFYRKEGDSQKETGSMRQVNSKRQANRKRQADSMRQANSKRQANSMRQAEKEKGRQKEADTVDKKR